MSDFSNLPPLNALRGFEAVARHMSFSAAAQELRITSAAVSPLSTAHRAVWMAKKGCINQARRLLASEASAVK